jgi:hypothetical protein
MYSLIATLEAVVGAFFAAQSVQEYPMICDESARDANTPV